MASDEVLRPLRPQGFHLCLGYKGNCIKDYFLHYDESVSNDFVWSQGGKKIHF